MATDDACLATVDGFHVPICSFCAGLADIDSTVIDEIKAEAARIKAAAAVANAQPTDTVVCRYCGVWEEIPSHLAKEYSRGCCVDCASAGVPDKYRGTFTIVAPDDVDSAEEIDEHFSDSLHDLDELPW